MRFRLTVLVLAAALLAGSAMAPAAVRAAVKEVRFVRAVQREWAAETECAGVVEQLGKRQVFIGAPLIAESVLVGPGDRVREGDTLAVIDTGTTRAVLSQSVVTERESGAPALSDEQMEKLEQAAALYGVSLDEALPGAGARLRQAQPQTQTIAVPSEILAPMDGVVVDVALTSGVLTQAAGPVFTLAGEGAFSVRAAVSEYHADAVRPGDAAVITLEAVPERAYSGVVTAVAPAAQRASGSATVGVTVEVLEADEHLRDGYSANLTITSQESRPLVSLPYEAVGQDAHNREYVWVYGEGRARRRAVETGEELQNGVEIVSGVAAGEAVLIDARGVLEDGDRVRLGGEGLA